MQRIKAFAGALALFAALAADAGAQTFPTKPVRIVVGFLAGGGVDVVVRIFTPKLAEYWGQQVIVENRPGGGGTAGGQAVATAEPDG